MNLPNRLSLLRIALVPVFLVCLFFDRIVPGMGPWGVAAFRIIGLLALIAATITDYYDGKLARERNMVTNLGKLLDPLADKLLVSASLIALVDLRIYPAWPVIVILFREFFVTGLRSLAAVDGRIIHADKWGKHKTGWQLATVITAVVFLTLRDLLRAWGVWEVPLCRYWFADIFFDAILWALLLISIMFTVISGWLYWWHNRNLLHES